MLFFLEFSCRGLVSVIFGPKIFFSLSRPISSCFGLKYCRKEVFKIFCNFSWNFLAAVEYERNSELKFFSPFLGLSHPVLDKNNAGMRFFNLMNFFTIFFRIFLAGVEKERNSGLNIFSLFFDLSHPVLARNNFGSMFFNFMIFFAIFFGIFLLGSSMNRIRD